ncbi:hypothetical protein M2282_003382 [Variovorax boronicumulans]|uniref:hypothetical protein n=1 Tax=Variovorax boronicumulans TaxID=436515 RepID=UPI00247602DF|nr:hypothetical protein [Variovorax boronicumulans]MDH6168231.1 hypothetical protein [Variovorax boronicumulans]
MNTESNTPPNGDFARYVEQLSARAAQPGRVAQSGEHGLDVGMTPGPGAQGPAATAAQRRESSNGEGATSLIGPTMLKVLGGVGALLFVVLWVAGVPFFVLVLAVGVALWFGKSFFKGLKLTPGVAKWQQVLEEAARKQREQQQKQGK